MPSMSPGQNRLPQSAAAVIASCHRAMPLAPWACAALDQGMTQAFIGIAAAGQHLAQQAHSEQCLFGLRGQVSFT